MGYLVEVVPGPALPWLDGLAELVIDEPLVLLEPLVMPEFVEVVVPERVASDAAGGLLVGAVEPPPWAWLG